MKMARATLFEPEFVASERKKKFHGTGFYANS
ncbi:MAG: hypothetical protein ACI9QL_003853 [Candidatus Omnitrophota bacterium]|jgi:hypothetical protein